MKNESCLPTFDSLIVEKLWISMLNHYEYCGYNDEERELYQRHSLYNRTLVDTALLFLCLFFVSFWVESSINTLRVFRDTALPLNTVLFTWFDFRAILWYNRVNIGDIMDKLYCSECGEELIGTWAILEKKKLEPLCKFHWQDLHAETYEEERED